MPFNRGQQGEYRKLAKAAWELHCKRHGGPVGDRQALAEWTREQLQKSTGKTSSKDCDGGRDFDVATAHLEAIAETGYNCQLRLIRGDLKRIKYAARKIDPDYLRQFAGDDDFERYLKGIIARMFPSLEAPELHQLTNDQIRALTNAIRVDARRHLTSP